MNRLLIAALLLFPASYLSAQSAQSESTATGEAEPVMTALRPHYSQIKDYVIRSAEQMPAEDFAYRPTAEVRSFGEMIDHIIDSHYGFCAAALGEEPPARDEADDAEPTKAERVQSLRDSFAFCDRAYDLSDAAATRSLEMNGREFTPLYMLIYNVKHDNLHYGNLVTYLRINGLVPPSSQTTM